MPTYEYECLQSGRHFDKFQNMTDDALEKCPMCGGSVRRLIGTGGAVIFKGGGFYATDYGTASRSGAACGRSRPCCGRDVPCNSRPCDD